MSKYELPKRFDHKDIDVLKQFITETGKIIPARVTGISAANQRKITKSIKIKIFNHKVTNEKVRSSYYFKSQPIF